MAERSGELERAGALIRGDWDAQRIERTLRSAKRRRVKRIATRSIVAGSCLGLALFLALPSSPKPAVEVAHVAPAGAPTVVYENKPDSSLKVADKRSRADAPNLRDAGANEAKEEPVRRHKARVQWASSATGKPQTDWRERMQAGDARGAYAVLKDSKPKLSTIDDLMLAADAARRAGDPQAASVFLEQALHEHQGPRTAVVAFTLGRILRDELHRPGPAALAFMKVQATQDAPLAADALAREVEAWQGSGAKERAKQRAKLYVERYPSGERRAWMDRLLATP